MDAAEVRVLAERCVCHERPNALEPQPARLTLGERRRADERRRHEAERATGVEVAEEPPHPVVEHPLDVTGEHRVRLLRGAPHWSRD